MTMTDGNTVPVKAGISFVSHGEQTMVIQNGLSPRAVISAPTHVECDRQGAGAVLLDGSGSVEPDPGDTMASYEWFTDLGQVTQQYLGAGARLPVVLPLGSSHITLRGTDSDDQLTGTADTIITDADTTPPGS